MGVREFTKSGAFVAGVFGLVVVLVPFALEQIGAATDLFSFPVTKTIKGWFAGPAPVAAGGTTAKPVDWERYRQDLETFSQWAEVQGAAAISLPREPAVIYVKPAKEEVERQVWAVPVASCTTAEAAKQDRGYVFISGFDRLFREGDVIAPSERQCGYEIVGIGERCVWFRAVFDGTDDKPMGISKFPEFSRAEGDCLIRGNRKYVARDAFALARGGWLMVDSFLPPDCAVFKILDENRRVVASLLCVVIGEKGGK